MSGGDAVRRNRVAGFSPFHKLGLCFGFVITMAPLVEATGSFQEVRLADGTKPIVSFASASYSMPISERNGEIPRSSGAEFFTEFPLSFVTLHLAILGFVICLMLLPIFGRPRHVDRGVLTHFGDHLSAVATLMKRQGGESFARRRISEYMKRVRDETTGPWVINDPEHQDDPATHLHLAKVQPESPVAAMPQPTAVVLQNPQAPSDRPHDDANQTDRG